MKTLKALVLGSVLASSVASAETVSDKVNGVLQSAQTGLYDLMDKDMTTVNFAKGGSALSEAELRNIRAVYKSVLADASVGRIIVASWSDREAIKSGEKMPEAQVALAQKRGEAVKRILAEMTTKPVETYNMGQDSNWIGKVFGSQDSQVKEAVKGSSSAPKGARDLAATLESKGGPGRAVVIVKRDLKTENATTGR